MAQSQNHEKQRSGIIRSTASLDGNFKAAVYSFKRILRKSIQHTQQKCVNHWAWTQYGNPLVNISFRIKANMLYLLQYITLIVSTVARQKPIFVSGNTLYLIYQTQSHNMLVVKERPTKSIFCSSASPSLSKTHVTPTSNNFLWTMYLAQVVTEIFTSV